MAELRMRNEEIAVQPAQTLVGLRESWSGGREVKIVVLE